jgi:hypothetical protein
MMIAQRLPAVLRQIHILERFGLWATADAQCELAVLMPRHGFCQHNAAGYDALMAMMGEPFSPVLHLTT